MTANINTRCKIFTGNYLAFSCCTVVMSAVCKGLTLSYFISCRNDQPPLPTPSLFLRLYLTWASLCWLSASPGLATALLVSSIRLADLSMTSPAQSSMAFRAGESFVVAATPLAAEAKDFRAWATSLAAMPGSNRRVGLGLSWWIPLQCTCNYGDVNLYYKNDITWREPIPPGPIVHSSMIFNSSATTICMYMIMCSTQDPVQPTLEYNLI